MDNSIVFFYIIFFLCILMFPPDSYDFDVYWYFITATFMWQIMYKFVYFQHVPYVRILVFMS